MGTSSMAPSKSECREREDRAPRPLIRHTYRRYCVSYTNHLTPIPDGLSMEVAAPVLCSGVTVWKAIKQANTKPGDTILIVGAGGGLGHLAVQYASAIGLRVIALDTGDEKKKLCADYGAEAFVDFKEAGDKLVDKIKEVTGGLGPHVSAISSVPLSTYSGSH